LLYLILVCFHADTIESNKRYLIEGVEVVKVTLLEDDLEEHSHTVNVD